MSPVLKDQIAVMGIDFVDDLQDLLEDSVLVQQIKDSLKEEEFLIFLNACKSTKSLCDLASSIEDNSPNLLNSQFEPIQNIQQPRIGGNDYTDNQNQCSFSDPMDGLKRKIDRLELKSPKEPKAKPEDFQDKNHNSIKLKEAAIIRNQSNLKIQASLDILFCLDITGSMGPYISAAHEKIIQLSDSLKQIHPDVTIRFSFIGYRDHCDGSNRFAMLNFTSDLEQFKVFVASTRASGGGDGPEDILGALVNVATMNWSSNNKVLYHIADAPCHGNKYHDIKIKDDYPEGDPHGLKPFNVLKILMEKKIQYYFGEINTSTNVMIDAFNKEVGLPYIQKTTMNQNNMIDVLTKSVSVVLISSLSNSSRTEGGTIKLRDIILESSIPDWSLILVERVFKYKMFSIGDLDEILRVNTCTMKVVEDFPEESIEIKVSKAPFAKGSMRAAYYSQLVNDDKLYVVKESMALSLSHLTKRKYEESISCHHVAKFLSSLFNDVINGNGISNKIVFSNITILQFMARENQPYMIIEESLNGRWEKYNNNNGLCIPIPSPETGVYDERCDCFHLTDPAVHCENLAKFGGTNSGKTGFDNFYKTHRCNKYCTLLGISL